jgi:hypothetical protein
MKKSSLSLSLLFLSSLLSAESALFNISANGMKMDYREYDSDGVILDSEKSTLEIKGISSSLEIELHNNITRTSLIMDYQYIEGETEYVGSYLGGTGVYGDVVSTTKNKITQKEAYIKEAYIKDNTELFIGLGGGHRLWERKLTSTQVEDYEWFYLKGSLGFLHQFNNGICLGAEYVYTKALSPQMIYYDTPNLVFDLGSVYSHSVTVPIIIPVNNRMDIRFETKYEKLTINESNIVSGFYEPDSKSNNIYSKVGIDIHF